MSNWCPLKVTYWKVVHATWRKPTRPHDKRLHVKGCGAVCANPYLAPHPHPHLPPRAPCSIAPLSHKEQLRRHQLHPAPAPAPAQDPAPAPAPLSDEHTSPLKEADSRAPRALGSVTA